MRLLHAMSEFGAVHGFTKVIRVSSIEARRHPLVAFPHRHDFFQLLVVLRGRGFHEIDFSRESVRSNWIYFVKPGQVHTWNLEPNSAGFLVEFVDEAIVPGMEVLDPTWSAHDILDQININKKPTEVRGAFIGLLRLMAEEYEKQLPDFEMALRHYLIPLLIQLHRLCEGRKCARTKGYLFIEHFLSLLAVNFKSEHRVSFYAKKMNTTSRALTMRISRGLGKSANKVIHERCVLEAKRLLAHSSLTVAEVGFEIGFDDPNYFSRFFKKNAGMNPGDFREKTRR